MINCKSVKFLTTYPGLGFKKSDRSYVCFKKIIILQQLYFMQSYFSSNEKNRNNYLRGYPAAMTYLPVNAFFDTLLMPMTGPQAQTI